jgi:hypothetical protein
MSARHGSKRALGRLLPIAARDKMIGYEYPMNDFDMIETVKAEAMKLAVDPNALEASGLTLQIPVPTVRAEFGQNPFPSITRHRYAAILPVLAERRGLEVAGTSDGEFVLVRQREVA